MSVGVGDDQAHLSRSYSEMSEGEGGGQIVFFLGCASRGSGFSHSIQLYFVFIQHT